MATGEPNSVRFNWNVFPSTRLQESHTGQLACNYTLATADRETDGTLLLPSSTLKSVQCLNLGCRALLNKFCKVDSVKNTWQCCICKTLNNVPDNKKDLQILKSILARSCIEYASPLSTQGAKNVVSSETQILVLVVDLATEPEELLSLKSSLASLLFQLLGQNALVALITFDSKVFLYEIDTAIAHAYGTESQLNTDALFQGRYDQYRIFKYLYQLNEPSDLQRLKVFIDGLQSSYSQTRAKTRSLRVNGKALQIALQFIKLFKSEVKGLVPPANTHVLANIVLVTSGPCTEGPGKVINSPLSNTFRNHHVLESFSELHMLQKATSFYSQLVYDNLKELAESDAGKKGVSVAVKFDVFGASLNEVGLFEMQNLCVLTGGQFVQCDTFQSNLFKKSFQRLAQQYNGEGGSNATLQIQTSSNLKVSGVIGSAISLKNNSQYASDMRVGESSTNYWLVSYFDKHNSVAVFFQKVGFKPVNASPHYIQFKLRYKSLSDNKVKTRVTTVCKRSGSTALELVMGFDQISFTTTLLKQVIHENLFELKSGELHLADEKLDTRLQHLIAHFARRFIPNDSKDDGLVSRNGEISLNSKFAKLPELFYHARKSFIFNKFNISPDETGFYNSCFLKSDITTLETIIRPQLYRLSVDINSRETMASHTSIDRNDDGTLVRSVPLNSSVLTSSATAILIYDTMFQVLVHYGSSIAYYRDYFKTHIGPDTDTTNLSTVQDSLASFKQRHALRVSSIHAPVSAALDPTVHLLDTVDFLAIFTLISVAQLRAFALMQDRAVLPRYIETDENKSQARFLYSRLSPPDAGTYGPYVGSGGGAVVSEDLSLNDYFEKMCSGALKIVEESERI